MEKIIDNMGGVRHEFEVTDTWPVGGYEVWAIGRRNFPYIGFLPLARETAVPHHIDPTTLKALRVGNERLCLRALKEAVMHGGVDEARLEELRKETQRETTGERS